LYPLPSQNHSCGKSSFAFGASSYSFSSFLCSSVSFPVCLFAAAVRAFESSTHKTLPQKDTDTRRYLNPSETGPEAQATSFTNQKEVATEHNAA
jgi:hypothetical protein